MRIFIRGGLPRGLRRRFVRIAAEGVAGAKRPVLPPSRIRQLNTDGDGFRSTAKANRPARACRAKPTSASDAPASTVAVT